MSDDQKKEQAREELIKKELVNAKNIVDGWRKLREQNLAGEGKMDIKKLKSDLKKSTAFVKRCKSFSTDDYDWCKAQVETYNLTRYTSEIVQALAQAVTDGKLKAADSVSAAKIVSLLNATYKTFAADFTTALVKNLQNNTSLCDTPTEGACSVVCTRSTCRLLVELFQVGVVTDVKILKKVMKSIVFPGSEASPSEVPPPTERSLSLVQLLLKYYGHDIFGITSATGEQLVSDDKPPSPPETMADSELPSWSLTAHRYAIDKRDPLISLSDTDVFKNGFKKYFKAGILTHNKLLADYKSSYEQSLQIINTKGELPEDKKTALQEQKKAFERCVQLVSQIADSLNCVSEAPESQDEEMQKMTSGETSKNITFMGGQSSYYAPVEEFGTSSTFDDEDQRAFYEDLPDISSALPEWVVNSSLRKAIIKGTKAERTADTESSPERDRDEPISGKVKFAEGTKETDGKDDQHKNDHPPKEKDEKDKRKPDYTVIDALISQMPERCTGKVSTDAWVGEFLEDCFHPPNVTFSESPTPADILFLGSFAATCRKKLSKAIFEVPRNSFNLFPQYIRVAATFTEIWKDMGPNLVSSFEDEFERQYSQQNQLWIEERRRNIRMIAELVKFKICQPSLILRLLARLTDNFVHHNIEVACHLLESCGRFLYRGLASSVRFQNLLQHVKRQRQHKDLDPRHDMMVEAALVESLPPELDSAPRPVKRLRQYSEKEEYVRYLLFTQLKGRKNVQQVAKALRKLNWKEPSTERIIVTNLRKVHRVKYTVIPLIASLISTLGESHPTVGIRVVDSLLESIRLGLEICPPVSDISQPISPQKRLLELQLLSELCISRVIGSEHVLFDTLYVLLWYAGWNDPPGYYFRVRMVTAILQSCTVYLTESRAACKKLFRFLPYYYRYIHSKAHPFPIDLDYKVADYLDHLYAVTEKQARPFISFPETIGGANAMVKNVEQVLQHGRFNSKSLLGGKNVAQLTFMKNLQEALGNPGVSIEGGARKQLLSNSIVPFRTKVYPLGMTSEVDSADEDEDDEEEVSTEQKDVAQPTTATATTATTPTASTPTADEDGRDPEELDPSQDEDYSRGRFLIPAAGAGFTSTRRKDANRSTEDEEFDSLFKEALRGPTSASTDVNRSGKRSGTKLDDKIASTMNIPLASLMRANDKRVSRAALSDSDHSEVEEATPFTVVLRRKTESNASVRVGTKSLAVGTLQVPTTSDFIVNQIDTRQRAQDEADQARLRTLELQNQSQAQEAGEAYPARKSGRKY